MIEQPHNPGGIGDTEVNTGNATDGGTVRLECRGLVRHDLGVGTANRKHLSRVNDPRSGSRIDRAGHVDRNSTDHEPGIASATGFVGQRLILDQIRVRTRCGVDLAPSKLDGGAITTAVGLAPWSFASLIPWRT
jgi:hypothetical protein